MTRADGCVSYIMIIRLIQLEVIFKHDDKQVINNKHTRYFRQQSIIGKDAIKMCLYAKYLSLGSLFFTAVNVKCLDTNSSPNKQKII